MAKRRPPPRNVRRVQHIDGNIPIIHTNKAGRTIQCESYLEYRAAIKLDHDSHIKDYISQPETIHFVDKKGKPRRYTPDFLVWSFDGATTLLEITVRERFENQIYRQERKEAAELICEARGWQHVMLDENDLPNETEFANLLGVYCFRSRNYANERVTELLQELLEPNNSVSFNKIAAFIETETNLARGVVDAAIYHLLWHCYLETDWNRLLVINSRPAKNALIWLPINPTPPDLSI